jgi:hypothetical protein
VRERCRVTFADHIGSNPRSVVRAAKEAANEIGPFDEVWVVFDTEGPQNPERLNAARSAVEDARQLGYKTAISNPCFEYWLILHFENCTATLEDNEAACRRLRKHIRAGTKRG